MPRRKTKEEFIEDSVLIHGNRYDYSLVDYKNMKTKVNIICKEHGIFEQRPDHHINNSGCPKCSILNRSIILSLDKKEFINKSKDIHNDKYNYSLINYKNSHNKVNIICKEHGLFKQTPNSHLNGNGCPKCGFYIMGNKKRLSIIEFINKSKEIHGNKYDYSLVKYDKSIKKVKIICKKHNFIFYKSPNNHISKRQGCPKCIQSNGEKMVMEYLENNNINYNYQMIFDDCRFIRPLKFDFYLSQYNLVIEYDGEQHTNNEHYFNTKNNFNHQLIRDKIKNKYCSDNNINLIRIRYDEDIEEKLKNHLVVANILSG